MALFVVQFAPKDLERFNKEFLTDMTVSKNSIHVRDGASVHMDKAFLYVRVMGGDEKVAAAKKLFVEKKFGALLKDADATKVSAAIDKEEEEAAEGMGMIFGG
ncbi:MAG: hypothetical protein HYT80_03465 [Euryarchaeota archaeon]|nr:hypothetical protein [Euryarchaeota archaeon]